MSRKVPAAVKRAAAQGLTLRKEHNRGGTQVGVTRANQLSQGKDISDDVIKRMVSYFARHEVDKQGKGWADKEKPSAGYIAWLLWGGDAGKKWAESEKKKLEKA